ncbi:MarR family winged helix-turn-helix transcriptional regulator [Falsiroseomonas oryzae]|uniref:MarR family winged helix-turn-helix transcriptional regulator n=1 Tax=Falsiroseomonas oryzae TaxID=2766473 RepID=UPI0022EB80DA|nr:MarR family transcriptional regulator [Roseomonas sp. MO-31]
MSRRAAPLPLEESLGFQVRDLNRLMQRALAARIAPHGVAPGAWYFLRVLWEEDGLTQRALAARIGMQEPTAVIALRGMEEAGWITRARSEDDRRKVHVHLTPAGRRLRETLLPEARAVIAQATRGMTEAERAALLALLRRARASLEGA